MSARISPTVRRRRLALELRRLREEAGITAFQVAEELGCSPSKISQMETCRVAITVPDAKAMAELYGASAQCRAELVELAREAKARAWWSAYNDVMQPWQRHYIGLEVESAAFRCYQADHVPGLLQTEDYLRALRAGDLRRWTSAELDRIVAVRDNRQAMLDGADPPELWYVLDEAVLRRMVGSPEIMFGQLSRLLETGRRGNVTLQVLPFAGAGHLATDGSFALLEFPDVELVYVEYLTGARYVEGEDEVSQYRTAFDALTAAALSKTRSTALIKDIMKNL